MMKGVSPLVACNKCLRCSARSPRNLAPSEFSETLHRKRPNFHKRNSDTVTFVDPLLIHVVSCPILCAVPCWGLRWRRGLGSRALRSLLIRENRTEKKGDENPVKIPSKKNSMIDASRHFVILKSHEKHEKSLDVQNTKSLRVPSTSHKVHDKSCTALLSYLSCSASLKKNRVNDWHSRTLPITLQHQMQIDAFSPAHSLSIQWDYPIQLDAFIRSHCVFWPFDIGWFSVLSFSPRQVCVSTMHLASSQVTHEIKVMKKMKQLSSESLAAQTYFDSHSDQTRQLDNEAHSARSPRARGPRGPS